MNITPWKDYQGEEVLYTVRWVGLYKLTVYRAGRIGGGFVWWAEVTGMPPARADTLSEGKALAEQMMHTELVGLAEQLRDGAREEEP